MKQEFHEAASSLYNSYTRKWKEDGGKILGYTCSYAPEEVIYAAGMLPCRLRGTGAASSEISDTYFGPFICSFPKCILQLAGEGTYRFLDGAVIAPGCDSMRRLDECWRKAGNEYEGTLPSFFFYMGIPHKVSEYSLRWFEEEIKKMAGSIEKHFGLSISESSLRAAIKEYNRGRSFLKRLDEIRCSEGSPVSGADAMAAVLAGHSIPRSIYNGLLEEYIDELERGGIRPAAGGKRILLAGSAADDIRLVKLIEDEGAVVVADTLCFGARFYSGLVDEGEDPITALAKRYLTHLSCPRMFGKYRERLEIIKEHALKARVQGVILQNIRFCDLHGSENGMLEKHLEALGIPCLKIERQYGPLSDTGRIRMRLNAFLEMIG
ncbi:MAG: 2-hydroxyacyl-CoA dehydratase subunit D [Bacillota bacterium]